MPMDACEGRQHHPLQHTTPSAIPSVQSDYTESNRQRQHRTTTTRGKPARFSPEPARADLQRTSNSVDTLSLCAWLPIGRANTPMGPGGTVDDVPTRHSEMRAPHSMCSHTIQCPDNVCILTFVLTDTGGAGRFVEEELVLPV
eukprot:m.1137609 g.1137609  ORF g.1137609 m.1137609 type:complete len:143 (+) comp24435_c0_seq38:947-1375(+)